MKIEDYLDGLASLHGKELNAIAAKIFLNALKGYSEAAVVSSLERCARELRSFPTISDVISRIDDGRPGVEEAWALCPHSESDTAVWTKEISQAFFEAARPLLDEDPMAARMAFKEKYTALLQVARAEKRTVSWSVTLGLDKAQRETVIRQAVEQGRIGIDEGMKMLPDTAFNQSALLPKLTGPKTAHIGILLPEIKRGSEP